MNTKAHGQENDGEEPTNRHGEQGNEDHNGDCLEQKKMDSNIDCYFSTGL